MPCAHKFSHRLNLTQLDFEPETLIVGTFTPAWPANEAEWFYGRTTDNYLWDILPRLYGQPSLIHASPVEWKQFCRDYRIAFTDLISSIDDADEASSKHNRMLASLSDKALVFNFDDFSYTDVVRLLKAHPSIKNVYITRGITEAFWKHLWNPVVHYCSRHGLHIRTLLSPTEDADYHYETYKGEHPEDGSVSLSDYLLMRWKKDWHK